jgi:hypothetical protein
MAKIFVRGYPFFHDMYLSLWNMEHSTFIYVYNITLMNTRNELPYWLEYKTAYFFPNYSFLEKRGRLIFGSLRINMKMIMKKLLRTEWHVQSFKKEIWFSRCKNSGLDLFNPVHISHSKFLFKINFNIILCTLFVYLIDLHFNANGFMFIRNSCTILPDYMASNRRRWHSSR